MTIGGVLVSLFPPLLTLSIFANIAYWIMEPSWIPPTVLLVQLYVLPVFLFRIHNLFWPLKEGVYDIGAKVYNPWWGSYQFQKIYMCVPFLEWWMHMVPGLYSFWLRCWGSKVGKGVMWTPRVEILDRTLMDIGDRVVFGYLCGFSCHGVSPINGKNALIVKKIKIGDKAFIGVEARVGPGVTIESKQLVKPQSALYWKGEYKRP